MFARFIHRLKARAAARSYARRLPVQIRKDYGAGAAWSPAQIRKSMERAGLPRAFEAFGYALFLDEAAFAACACDRHGMDDDGIRRLLAKYAPRVAVAGFEPAAENWMAVGDGGSNHPGI